MTVKFTKDSEIPLRAQEALKSEVIDWNKADPKYKRLGKCKKCGRCCREMPLIIPENKHGQHMACIWDSVELDGKDYVIVDKPCKWLGVEHAIKLDSLKIHEETEIIPECSIYPKRFKRCHHFPARPDDPVYINVKDTCGYRFVLRDEYKEEEDVQKPIDDKQSEQTENQESKTE